MTDPKLTPAETPPLPLGIKWRMLVAVPLLASGRSFDFDILIASETGLKRYGVWDWLDASHYCLLDPERKETTDAKEA